MKAWNEPLGLCRFEDLPPVYQDWFAHGAEPTHLYASRMFVPEKHPWVSAALTPIWLLLSSTPWIAILDSTSAPRDAIALSALGAALLPPLWVVLRSVRAVAGVVAIRDAARRGADLYGLAVDDQALVLRLFQPFAWTSKTCLYVPRSHITGYAKPQSLMRPRETIARRLCACSSAITTGKFSLRGSHLAARWPSDHSHWKRS